MHRNLPSFALISHPPAAFSPPATARPRLARTALRWLLVACWLVLAALLAAVTAGAQTTGGVTTLYSFRNDTSLGYQPRGRLLQGSDNALYGTTYGNGAQANPGSAVFRLTRDGGTYRALRAFPTDGTKINAGLIQGSDGAFYGTASSGGTGSGGLVFRVTADGTYTVLHNFSYSVDGAVPTGRLTQTADGTLYGTTLNGGPSGRNGTIFRLNTDGTGFATLYQFPGTSGPNPSGALVQDDDGSFYGTLEGSTVGTVDQVFRLNVDGTVSTLATFSFASDRDSGYSITPELLRVGSGVFLGTTSAGGQGATVFKITRDGTRTILARFPVNPSNPRINPSPLTLGPDGYYYGTTEAGGTNGLGSLFRFSEAGGVETLYSFAQGANGTVPLGGLLLANDGGLYGTTNGGGANSLGTVFRFDRAVVQPAGTAAFAAASYNTTNTPSTLTLTVNRTGGSAGAGRVFFFTSSGTAVDQRDYSNDQGYLSWADGDTASKTILIRIFGRTSYEANEPTTLNFTVNLTQETGSPIAVGTPASSTVNIIRSTGLPTQPTATISAPQDDLRFVQGSAVSLAATVSDPAGALRELRFSLNDATVASFAPGGPYVFDATGLAAGRYQFVTTAFDNFSRTSFASRAFSIVAEDPSNPVPGTRVFADYDNRLFPGGQVVVLSALVDVFGLTRDQLSQLCFFYNGILIAAFDNAGNLLPGGLADVDQFSNGLFGAVGSAENATVRSALYLARFRVPRINGAIRLTTVAVSRTGVSRTSGAITVRADNSGTGSAVTSLALSSPAAGGAPVRLGVPIPFTVSVGGAAALVEYFVNGVKVGSGTRAPFSFSVPTPVGGTYLLNAVATDAGGLTTATEPVAVEVEGTPVVSFLVPGANGGIETLVNEGGAKAKFFVVRAGGDLSQPLTVRYKANGDAVAGRNYQALSGTVTIPAGQSRVKLKVKPLRDGVRDATRSVKLKLLGSASGAYVVGTPAKVKARVLNVD